MHIASYFRGITSIIPMSKSKWLRRVFLYLFYSSHLRIIFFLFAGGFSHGHIVGINFCFLFRIRIEYSFQSLIILDNVFDWDCLTSSEIILLKVADSLRFGRSSWVDRPACILSKRIFIFRWILHYSYFLSRKFDRFDWIYWLRFYWFP